VRAIITYHSIDSSRSPISISERDFRRHLNWLATSRVSVVPLDALVSADHSGDSVALTFDDAYQNFGSIAAPLLEEHGMPATLFVATAHAGGTNAWDTPARGGGKGQVPVFPLLDWNGIARVAQRGVAIGSHARTHRQLPLLDAHALRDELASSSEDLRRELGVAPTALAYPYGDAASREKEEAARIYDLAVGTELRILEKTEDQHMLPRIDAYYLREAGRLESFGSAAFDRYLRIRRRGRRLRASVHRLTGRGGG